MTIYAVTFTPSESVSENPITVCLKAVSASSMIKSLGREYGNLFNQIETTIQWKEVADIDEVVETKLTNRNTAPCRVMRNMTVYVGNNISNHFVVEDVMGVAKVLNGSLKLFVPSKKLEKYKKLRIVSDTSKLDATQIKKMTTMVRKEDRKKSYPTYKVSFISRLSQEKEVVYISAMNVKALIRKLNNKYGVLFHQSNTEIEWKKIPSYLVAENKEYDYTTQTGKRFNYEIKIESDDFFFGNCTLSNSPRSAIQKVITSNYLGDIFIEQATKMTIKALSEEAL